MGRLQPLCHKTKSCKYHAAGRCKKGAACTFAHGSQELLPRPVFIENKARAAAAAGAAGAAAPLLGLDADAAAAAVPRLPGAVLEAPGAPGSLGAPMQPQAMAPMGRFPPADAEELSSQSDSAQGSGAAPGEEEAEGDPSKARTRLNKFHKTQLCMFHQMGKCKKRASCRFAHGTDELRPVPDLYRTKLCPTMLEAGQCNDDECRFAHSAEELRHLEEEEDGLLEAQEPQGARPEPAMAPAYLPAPLPGGACAELRRPSLARPEPPQHPAPVPPPEPQSPDLRAFAPGAAWPAPHWGLLGEPPGGSGAPGLLAGARAPFGLLQGEVPPVAAPGPHDLGEYPRTVQGGRAFQGYGARQDGPHGPPGAVRKQLCPALLNLGKCPDPSCPFAHSAAPPPRPPAAYPGAGTPGFSEPLFAQPPPAGLRRAQLGGGLPLPPEQLQSLAAYRDAYRLDWPAARGLAEADEREQAFAAQRQPSFEDHSLFRFANSIEGLRRASAAQQTYAGLADERNSQLAHASMAPAYLTALPQDQALRSAHLAPGPLEGTLTHPDVQDSFVGPSMPRKLGLPGVQRQGGYRDPEDWAAPATVHAGQGLGAEMLLGSREEPRPQVEAEPSFVAERGPEVRVPRLRVKNTFLTVQEPSAFQERPRSRTVPTPSLFDDEAADGFGALSFPLGVAAEGPGRLGGLGALDRAPPAPEAQWPGQLAFPDAERAADLAALGARREARPGPGDLAEPGGAGQIGQGGAELGAPGDASPVQEPSVQRLRVKNTFLTVDEAEHVAALPRSRTLPVPTAADLDEPLGGPDPAPARAEAEASPTRRFGLIKRRSLLPQIGEAAEGAGGPEQPPLPFSGPLGGLGATSPAADF